MRTLSNLNAGTTQIERGKRFMESAGMGSFGFGIVPVLRSITRG